MFNVVGALIKRHRANKSSKLRPVPKINSNFVFVSPNYASLCCGLTIKSPQLLQVLLQMFLFERGISYYDSAQVRKYIKYQCRKVRTLGIWRPLRPLDRDNAFDCTPLYDKVVPTHVLTLVRCIRDEFPSAKFFVYDLIGDSDSFIGAHFYDNVWLADREGPLDKMVVFGMWGEPGLSG